MFGGCPVMHTTPTQTMNPRKPKKSRLPKIISAPRPLGHAIHPDAAGIDIGAEELVVAVPHGRGASPYVRTFSAFTEGLLTRLDSDLVELLEATIDGRLGGVQAKWKAESAVCVILASGGYPGSYANGKPISGLDRVPDDITVFHAGTRRDGDQIVTAGGRVLGVTALATDLAAAREKAYAAVEGLTFEGRQFRRDIAVKGLSA